MLNPLPNTLYSCKQVRQIDHCAIEQHSIPGAVLMKRAARSAYQKACDLWPENSTWLIVCGGGNNAGDGYAFAAIAQQNGHKAKVFHLKEPSQLTGDAFKAYKYAGQENAEILAFDAHNLNVATEEACVLVDAILGSGLSGPVKENVKNAIDQINELSLPVLALDIPSGLCGDTGNELGTSIKADHTVTFVGLKRGLFTAHGPASAGAISFSDLKIPQEAYKAVEGPVIDRLQTSFCARPKPKAADAHKGQCGTLMVVGGDLGYGGAAIMAAESAAYSGGDMVALATRHEHIGAAIMRRPEIMARGVPSGQELEPMLERADIILVGPGLGQTPWSEQMLQQAILAKKPLVLDADALNILSAGRIPWPTDVPLVITPHPGEAARLLNLSVAQVQQDRFAAVEKLQKLCGGVVVLKGAGSVIHDGKVCSVANVGNAGLATAGSGDVLSGVIGALMAQGLSPTEAASLAVCVHGDAADLLVEDVGVRGLMASELLPYVRELLR